MDWRENALCKRFPDINFVPDPFLGESSEPAKQVCFHCRVSSSCRAYRREHPELLGVWGGEDEVDITMAQDTPAPAAPECSCDEKAGVVQTILGVVCTTCGKVEA